MPGPADVVDRPAVPGPVCRAWFVVVRSIAAYRSAWKLFVTGFLEPVLYLFSIGIGVGQLIEGFTVDGRQVSYAMFVAPAMLATSAMNGAMYDSTFGVFFRLKYDKVYDQLLATPIGTTDIARGEIAWSLIRGGTYSAAFLAVMTLMGLVASPWAVLALPAAWLICWSFACVFMGLTTYLTSWQDFDKITLLQLPLFLFSATFFPVSTYDPVVRWVVEGTPLYRGVVLCRELTLGTVGWGSVVSVAYLCVMGLVGLMVVRRRLATLLVI